MTTLWEQPYWPVPLAVAIFAATLAAWIDVRTHRIPNRLTFPLLLGGLAWSTAAAGWLGLGEALLACFVTALPHLIGYAIAGSKAGDAKLMGALGAWLGVVGGLAAMASVALVGGVLAVIYAVAQKKQSAVLSNMGQMAVGLAGYVKGHVRREDLSATLPSSERMTPMPYGVSIALGTAIAAGGVVLWHAT